MQIRIFADRNLINDKHQIAQNKILYIFYIKKKKIGIFKFHVNHPSGKHRHALSPFSNGRLFRFIIKHIFPLNRQKAESNDPQNSPI